MWGTRREIRSKSSSSSGMPASWAMASRCSTAFVEPPVAMTTVMAFSSDSLVTTSLGRRPSRSWATTAIPASKAASARRSEIAGGVALPGSDRPIASTAVAIVFAV